MTHLKLFLSFLAQIYIFENMFLSRNLKVDFEFHFLMGNDVKHS